MAERYHDVPWGGGYWYDDNDSSGGQSTSQLADKWTQQWLGELDTVKDKLSGADQSIDALNTTGDRLGREFDTFTKRYSGVQNDLVETSRADLANRNKLGQQYMDLAEADYGGAMGQAAADVAHQTALSRGQMRRDAGRYGMDANRLESNLRKTYTDEAKNKVLAMVKAKQGEQARVANMSATGMQLFDPSHTLNPAIGIDQTRAGLLQSQAGVQSNVAGLKLNSASTYANTIANPVGEVGGVYRGWDLIDQHEKNQPSTGTHTTSYGLINPGSNFSAEAITQGAKDFAKTNWGWD